MASDITGYSSCPDDLFSPNAPTWKPEQPMALLVVGLASLPRICLASSASCSQPRCKARRHRKTSTTEGQKSTSRNVGTDLLLKPHCMFFRHSLPGSTRDWSGPWRFRVCRFRLVQLQRLPPPSGPAQRLILPNMADSPEQRCVARAPATLLPPSATQRHLLVALP